MRKKTFRNKKPKKNKSTRQVLKRNTHKIRLGGRTPNINDTDALRLFLIKILTSIKELIKDLEIEIETTPDATPGFGIVIQRNDLMGLIKQLKSDKFESPEFNYNDDDAKKI